MDIGLYSAVIDAKSTSDAWRDWSNAFNTVVNKHVKIKEIRVKDRSNPWMTNEILDLIYKRDYTHRMTVRLSSSDKMDKYKKLRNLVISTIRNSQRSYYKKTITVNISCDVWKAVNQSLGKNRKSSIRSDLSPDAWNDHFASVGNKLCSKFSENDELIWRNNSSIYNFKFKSLLEEDVLAFINKLPSETNVDILGYDSCILKLSNEIICSSLTILFNMSLSNGEIPNEWKKARVTPVYKNKGSKQDNFRPISVIGHIPKLFEKLVDSQLREYLQSHSFITHSQSAFMKLHSTQTSLHNRIEYVLDNINENEINGICRFDLAECFDTIDHKLLLKKLSKYGFNDTELQWFTNYLNERTQVVTINGKMSNTKLIDKGVPRGSILGLLLFTIFINDFPSCLSNAFCNIFADDTMMLVIDL